MRADLLSLVLADAGVLAAGGDANRAAWGLRPQGSGLPALVLTLVSETGTQTHDGPAGLDNAQVQIDAYADSYGAALALGRALRAALDGHRGAQGATFFSRIAFEDSFEAVDNTGAETLFRVSSDFSIWHKGA